MRTVAELIEELRKFPPDAECDIYSPLPTVQLHKLDLPCITLHQSRHCAAERKRVRINQLADRIGGPRVESPNYGLIFMSERRNPKTVVPDWA